VRYKEMKIIGQFINKGRKISTPLVMSRVLAVTSQKRTLKKLLIKASGTQFGQFYHFNEILKSKNFADSFAETVPISSYSKMYPWWKRAYEGEENVTWPGKIEYFALSSGTSEGASKHIPVSADMLKSIKRASLRQIVNIAKTDLPKDFLTKHYLMIGGSTDLYYDGNVYSGDLSGITTQNIPFWFEKFSKPSMEIRGKRDWKEKIDKITAESVKWDVVMIAGTPAWVQLLMENIIKTYNLKSIHEIWPNLSIFIHGGVAINPYKKSLNALLDKPIMYFETYLASEGFVAFQTKLESKGMRLIFRNGIYYEFVPFSKENFTENGEILPTAKVVGLENVELGVDYAILLTTCAGAWRYLIGDTIRFENIDTCEIRITGRTKHFLSLCGEHLSVDNMNAALETVADTLQANFIEFTVKGVPYDNFFAHQWFVGADNPEKVESEKVRTLLDAELKRLNDDYATERTHALKDIMVAVLPNSVFIEWMEKYAKVGAQSKFPRVLSDERYAQWIDFLREKGYLSATQPTS
jgi:hypothetical protein